MDNNPIFENRKKLKENGHRIVRSHYFLLVFLMAVMVFFGSEFQLGVDVLPRRASGLFGNKTTQEAGTGTEENPGSILSSDDVMTQIVMGNFRKGNKIVELLEKKIAEEGDTSKSLGRTRGILSSVVNAMASGRLSIRLASALRSLTHSDAVTGVLISLLSILVFLFEFVLLKNVYGAVMRRLYLEARVYEKVQYLDVLHFPAVRRWIRASLTMFVEFLFEVLWSLTIIGGFIKQFSYFAVPYIVAENPDIKPLEAITLSRKMMDGHKLELLKYYITFLGWILLGIVTFGVSDLLYGAPYRLACYSEFYAQIRKQAIEKGIDGTERLNDRYLFEKADKIKLLETYFDVVDEITLIYENRTVLTGARKFLSDWFSIWLGSIANKKQYDNQEGRIMAIEGYKMSMDGMAYPQRLNPLAKTKEIRKQGNFSFIRSYTIWTLFLFFIIFSMIGWFWEVGLHYATYGELVNRGTLLGPWLPIYGSGGVFVLLLCSRFRKNPVAEFFMAMLVSGTLEYLGAWMLETRFHQRWWSYDGYFLNIHGRVCAEGLLAFGILCSIVVYLIAPVLDFVLSMLKPAVLMAVCIILGVLFGIDCGHSMVSPNRAKGAVETVETQSAATQADGESEAVQTEKALSAA